MDLIKLFKMIFGGNKKVTKAQQPVETDEKVLAYRELDNKKFEEMRINELEENLLKSFEAVNCVLTYMDNKVKNIAGHISYAKKLSFSQMANLFEKGVRICDCAMPNPFKFPKVIKYYYENFYSDEKQIEYYNYTQNVMTKYAQLEKDLEEKFK